MVILIAKCTIIAFGVFFIAAGFLMLFAPEKAREILRKAGIGSGRTQQQFQPCGKPRTLAAIN